MVLDIMTAFRTSVFRTNNFMRRMGFSEKLHHNEVLRLLRLATKVLVLIKG